MENRGGTFVSFDLKSHFITAMSLEPPHNTTLNLKRAFIPF